MDEFCGDTFWNTSLLLDNSWPELTPCFIDLVVTSAPCVAFWLSIPCHIYLTETRREARLHKYPSSSLNVAKLVCGCMLCVMTVLRLLEHLSQAESMAALVGDGVLLLTMVGATLMTQYERARGIMTSSPLFLFWLMKICCDVIPLYTHVMLKGYETDLEGFVQFLLSFGLTAVLLILYAFADPLAVFAFNKLNALGAKPCPESTASFLNQLLFAWLTKLMVRGYKKGVEMTDLCDLLPRDQSTRLLPIFERIWNQELQRCNRLQRDDCFKTVERRSIQDRTERLIKVFRSEQLQSLKSVPNKQNQVSYVNGHVTYSPGQPANGVSSERTPLLKGQYDKYDQSQTSKGIQQLKNSTFLSKAGDDQDSSDVDSCNGLLKSYDSEKENVCLREAQPPLTSDRPSGRRPSLTRALIRQFAGVMGVALALRLVSDIFLIASPLILGLLISHLNTRQAEREWQGYVLSVALLVSGALRTPLLAAGLYHAYYTGLQVKSVLIGAIFSKALRINNEAKKKATSGEVVSLMSVDVQRLQEFVSRIYFGMSVPFILLAVVGIMYTRVATAAFAGLLVLIVMVPVVGLICVYLKKAQQKLLLYKDERVKVFNEILNGMKVLKLYAWETSFERRVDDVRGREVKCLVQMALFYILLGLCTNMVPFLMTLTTYGWYVLSQRDHFLDPSSAFVIMSLLNIMTPALESMGILFSYFVQARVSLERIGDFLCSEELDFHSVSSTCELGVAIRLERATFTWDDPAYPVLKNISLKVDTGRLVAVVGTVGAGKSSLISCMLGEMAKMHGSVALKGTAAYVAQMAWIQNATLRDNILFGKDYHRDRYNAVIKACQLERDLTILQAGDMTEIGEKGTNLSGGQKQRVSLARAVYSDSDVYLLDDPLSAVDSHVGRAIFSDVISHKGILKTKTRVLVTHGIHWLPLVDEIVVLNHGQITEVGSYSQLMTHNGDFAQFLTTYFKQHNDAEDDIEEELTDPEVVEMRRKIWADVESVTTDGATSGDDLQFRLQDRSSRNRRKKEASKRLKKPSQTIKSTPSQIEADDTTEELGKLISSETLVKGRVPAQVYLYYPRAAGIVALSISVVAFAAFRAAGVGANFWLRQWTADPTLTNQTTWGSQVFVDTNDYYLLYYGLFGVLQVGLLLAYNALYWLRTVQASRRLHDRMISCLFRAPMAFFDTTPMGRIMNRVSTDMEIVDNLMPVIFRDLVSTISVLVAVIVVIIVVSPLSVVVLLPLAICGYFVLVAYVPASRQCRRMEAITRSPIFAHFSETLSGAATIRAYRATDRFVAESKTRVDANQVFYFTYVAGLRWIQMGLDGFTNIVTFLAAILEVISAQPSGGSVGLSVSYALQLIYTLNLLVRQVTDFETNIVSVERIKEYSEVQSEAPWVNPVRRPIPDWPHRGRIEMRNYQTRYREGLDLVLKGVTCDIQGGEKIGIVGRTGAGKSSLSLALFRLIEAAGGAILIDGINIADIGLHDLRSRLTILPQDPVLFSGTVRFNLDPFGEHEDTALWRALQQAHLQQFVQSLPGTLSFECGEEGLSLSVGQRQLLCLARTLLRRTSILLLDEATAAVDMETDALIQATVRQAFNSCTILTIAHRLNTIMDYDRIMVLDEGIIREFDTPANLLSTPNSAFAAMLKDTGL